MSIEFLGELLTQRSEPQSEMWTWATVTSLNPIQVRLDGEAAALAASPDSLYNTPAVGERVWVQLSGRRVIIHGSAGGGTAGVMDIYAGNTNTIPAGYLYCDGTVYNIADYPMLGARLGSLHGGNGTTTFAVPDMRGLMPVGMKPTDDWFNVTGVTGGEKTHILTEPEMPSHNHGVNDPSHNHGFYGGSHTYTWGIGGLPQSVYIQNAIAVAGNPPSNNLVTSQNAWTANAGAYTGISIQNKGGGQAHNNMPPYRAVNYIIRTF